MLFRITLLFWFLTSLSHPGAQAQWVIAPTPHGEYVPNEIILRFNGGYDIDDLKQEFEAAHGVTVSVRQINDAGTDFLILIKDGIEQEGENGTCVRAESAKDPLPCSMCDVIGNPGGGGPLGHADAVWPNYIGNAGLESVTPSGPSLHYGQFDEGGFDPFFRCDQGANLPYPALTGNRTNKVTVAILDTGIDPDQFGNFFDYKGGSTVGWKPVWDDEAVNTQDGHGHGTAVAYLAAQPFVNQRRAHNLQLLSYTVLDNTGTGDLATTLRAIDQATLHGVDVINLSLGFRAMDCDKNAHDIFGPYLDEANNKQVLVFCSAGNDGNNLFAYPQYPAAIDNAPNLFTIGADVCASTVHWEATNYGPGKVDLMAPGAQLLVPFTPSENLDHEPYGGYILAAGTSFSAPITAGMAAAYRYNHGYDDAFCYLESGAGMIDDLATPFSSNGSVLNLNPVTCVTSTPQFSTEAAFLNNSVASYPNPFQNAITIRADLSDQQPALITVHNDKGSLCIKIETVQMVNTINTTGFPPGIYFIRTVDANGTRTQKVIKH